MNFIQALYTQTMNLAEQVELGKLPEETAARQDLLARAFALEYRPAQQIAGPTDAEPTRSLLHRSAATPAVAPP